MNVILIFNDGWRADIANNPTLTPILHKFLNEYGGYKFTKAYSVTTWTWPVTMSIFTGLLPVQHGCDDIGYQKHDAEQNLALDIFAAKNCSKDEFLPTPGATMVGRIYIWKTTDEAKYRKYTCSNCGLGFEDTIPEENYPGTTDKIQTLCPSCHEIAEEEKDK